MNQLLTHEGDAHSTPAGRYSVNVINNGTACGQHLYRVTVTVPGFTPQPAFDRENDRPFGHTDQAQAQQLAEHYAAGLVELFTVEAEGITDERIAAVAQGVNAAMVERTPVDVSDELTNPAESWAAFRQQTTQEFRKVRPTKTRVFLKPLNATEKRALRQRHDRVVYVGKGISWLTLRNLAEKGYGTATTLPGRPKVTHLFLNQAGVDAAEQSMEVAA